MVAGPLVDYLANFSNYNVTVASNNIGEATNLARSRNNVIPKLLDITDDTALTKLIDQNDIVVR